MIHGIKISLDSIYVVSSTGIGKYVNNTYTNLQDALQTLYNSPGATFLLEQPYLLLYSAKVPPEVLKQRIHTILGSYYTLIAKLGEDRCISSTSEIVRKALYKASPTKYILINEAEVLLKTPITMPVKDKLGLMDAFTQIKFYELKNKNVNEPNN